MCARRATAGGAQVSSLNTLPAHWASSVHVAVDSQRLDLLRVLILPDGDTPYGNGAFLFDALLPASYPDAPPKVRRAARTAPRRSLVPFV